MQVIKASIDSIMATSIVKNIQARKKYSLGSDVDKEVVFDFPFLLQEDTVSYIKNHGKVMFILRGPPSTGKATLSEMLTTTYPEAEFCCADSYFKNSFASPVRSKASIADSHVYCEKKAKEACLSNAKTIIVQNTHIRKWEMQPYLDLAAEFHYTVIMAITLYRFDVTPEALLANNTDGLDIRYFRNRLRQWVHVPAVAMGWFLGPQDSAFVLASLLESLKELTGDAKFCRVFDVYDSGKIINYFRAKKVVFCVAGYSSDPSEMEKHYLSDEVQYFYGKSFSITILGYLINTSGAYAIVHLNEEMQLLTLDNKQTPGKRYDIADYMANLEVNSNLFNHSKTTVFKEDKIEEGITAVEENWLDEEEFKVARCSFIQLAVREEDLFKIDSTRKEFQSSMQLLADEDGVLSYSNFTELENGTQICRLEDESWVVKAPKKMVVKSIYSGLYV
ncbi:hypothetical protein JTE90_026305 [Oedothorax gibbosus]|uniref:2',3'-cyclic-nucleotide 3'-phosphodiesterase n=1 Tax=Oedothorax gibbosus TaxID=931172 RepID=A0AAV6U6Y3_9ARAC|nr:hypothetical protein JTE90_026305 [Oedothorax gibbosus]